MKTLDCQSIFGSGGLGGGGLLREFVLPFRATFRGRGLHHYEAARPKNSASFRCFLFQRFDHSAALKIERKMSHLNIAFDQDASIGTVMHYILVIS